MTKKNRGIVKKKCCFGIRFLSLTSFHPSASPLLLPLSLRRPAAAVGCSP